MACNKVLGMRNEFTAIIERDGDWFIAQCPEVLKQMVKVTLPMKRREILWQRIELVLEDRREDGLKAASADALREVVTVEK